MSPRPSLKDVARMAAVSHMTVSRVVRGERNVSAATVERVRQAIAKLKYQPDPALSALAAYRTLAGRRQHGSVLAFLEAESTEYCGLVLEGARTEAGRLGYSVDAFPLPTAASGQAALSRRLFHRGIHGLLVSPSNEPRRLEGWDWSRFAPVSLGALRHEPSMHAVAMDYFQGLLSAYEGIRALGYRRIALFLREDLEARTGHLWMGAYLSVARPALKPLLFREGRGIKRSVEKWCAAIRPDAVLTIHAAWHEMLSRRGIASAYLNDIATPHSAPRIRLDPRHIGREGVQAVHLLLLRRELGLPSLPKTILLRGEWHAT